MLFFYRSACFVWKKDGLLAFSSSCCRSYSTRSSSASRQAASFIALLFHGVQKKATDREIDVERWIAVSGRDDREEKKYARPTDSTVNVVIFPFLFTCCSPFASFLIHHRRRTSDNVLSSWLAPLAQRRTTTKKMYWSMNNEKRLYGLAIAKLNMLFTSMWVILHFIIVAAWQLHTNRWRQCDTLTPLATHKIYGRCEGRTICAKNGGGKNKKRPWKTIIYLTLFRFYFAFSMSPVPHVVWHSLTLSTHTFRSYIFCFFFVARFKNRNLVHSSWVRAVARV